MNKFFGYVEIEIQGEVIPVKMGAYATEEFCNNYGVTLREIGDIFQLEEYTTPDGDLINVEVPKDVLKFLANVLYAGANYASRIVGGKPYTIMDAYQWVDEIGYASPKAIEIITSFRKSIMFGGNPPVELAGESKGKKKKEQLTSGMS